MAMFDFSTKHALLNGKLKVPAKGDIYKNFAAETLIKSGYFLHYYKPDDNSELEFVIEKDGEVVPIEVKAENTATKSQNKFIEGFETSVAYKLISGNIGVNETKLSLPHYLAMFI